MSWVDDALADFGRSIGIAGLQFAADSPVSLEFERLGTLCFEQLDGCVLVYAVRRLDRPDEECLSAALDACHWRHNHPFPVQAGLHGGEHLTFAVRIPERDFALPMIERAVNFLGEMHDAVSEGVRA